MQIFTCPQCGKKYKVPENAAGKKVRCKNCQHVSRVPQDDTTIPLAEEPDFFSQAAAAAERASATASMASLSATGLDSDAVSPEVDRSAAEDAEYYVRTGREEDLRPGTRSFWGDVVWSFLFITQPNNIIMFGFIWIIFLIREVVGIIGLVGCLRVVIDLILTGWIYAYYLNCIKEMASGEDDLPKLTLTDGWLDDIIIPFFQYIGTWAVLMLPAVIYVIAVGVAAKGGLLLALLTLNGTGFTAIAGAVLVPLLILVGLGLFLWPIVILAVALGGLTTVYRVDLILATVFRTLLPYLATFLLVVAASVAQVVVNVAIASGGASNTTTLLSANKVVLMLLGLGATAYFNLATMRIVGLYYRHFKHRFAWTWE
jgi:predicted Zn finger-like uncharacterized protein